jgi:Zn-finger nucleic acid-binding protein
MKCPNDQTTLAMMERQGIEIDYCPTCRGVWLDRGELDKLIAASSPQSSLQQTPPPQSHQSSHSSSHSDDYYKQKKHRKESFLGELFDF